MPGDVTRDDFTAQASRGACNSRGENSILSFTCHESVIARLLGSPSTTQGFYLPGTRQDALRMGMGEQGFDGDEKRQLQMAKRQTTRRVGCHDRGIEDNRAVGDCRDFLRHRRYAGCGRPSRSSRSRGRLLRRSRRARGRARSDHRPQGQQEGQGRALRPREPRGEFLGRRRRAERLRRQQLLQLHPLRHEGQGEDQRQLVERLPDRNRGRRQPVQVRQSVQRQPRQRVVERPPVGHLYGEQAARQGVARSARAPRRTTSSRIPSSSRVSTRRCMPTST